MADDERGEKGHQEAHTRADPPAVPADRTPAGDQVALPGLDLDATGADPDDLLTGSPDLDARDVLSVAAESTAWATQLRLMAPQILARITADLPRGLVKKIVISGPSGPTWKHGPWSSRGRGPRDTYG